MEDCLELDLSIDGSGTSDVAIAESGDLSDWNTLNSLLSLFAEDALVGRDFGEDSPDVDS